MFGVPPRFFPRNIGSILSFPSSRESVNYSSHACSPPFAWIAFPILRSNVKNTSSKHSRDKIIVSFRSTRRGTPRSRLKINRKEIGIYRSISRQRHSNFNNKYTWLPALRTHPPVQLIVRLNKPIIAWIWNITGRILNLPLCPLFGLDRFFAHPLW